VKKAMKLVFTQDRALAVMAHPDDAELLCAGTLARAKADGAAIGICVMCAGDKGVPPTPTPNLAKVRQSEATAAAEILGAELYWFGSPDGELTDSVESRRKLVEIYRRFRPTLVLAHSPEDYHPDHRAASTLAEAASWFAASRGQVTDSPAIEQSPAVWFADTVDMIGFVPEIYIDVSAHMAVKEKMLQCHKTQLLREGDRDFTPLSDLMARQATARGAQAGVKAAEAFRVHRAFKRVRGW
jgi:LmbE family N-acetylglucosaminyl deacetylase